MSECGHLGNSSTVCVVLMASTAHSLKPTYKHNCQQSDKKMLWYQHNPFKIRTESPACKFCKDEHKFTDTNKNKSVHPRNAD